MDSDDQRETFVVKIETDVAEEPPVAWRTEHDERGQQRTVASFSHIASHKVRLRTWPHLAVGTNCNRCHIVCCSKARERQIYPFFHDRFDRKWVVVCGKEREKNTPSSSVVALQVFVCCLWERERDKIPSLSQNPSFSLLKING